jgi:hypothetical protein
MTKKAASMFNLFGLPGLDTLPNVGPLADKFSDSMDFVKNLWGGASSAVPGFLAPTLSAEELDKKITDLRAVESWLEANAGLLRATIQSLEVQRNTLLMLKSLGQMNATPAPSAPKPTEPTPAMANAAAWWNLLQDQFSKVAGAALAQAVPGQGVTAKAADNSMASATVAKKTAATKKPRAKKVALKRSASPAAPGS